MKNDALFDLLGNVSDKFYKEAMEEGFFETTEATISLKTAETEVIKRKKPLFRAILLASLSIIALCVTLTIIFLDNYNSLENTIAYCKKCTYENFGYVSEPEKLSCSVLDLDFDGEDEILIYSDSPLCPSPVFVFKGRKYIDSFGEKYPYEPYRIIEEMSLYENLEENEKFYYFYYYDNTNSSIHANIAAKITFDGEEYRTEALLSYGVFRYTDTETGKPEEAAFFRDDFNTDELKMDRNYSTLNYEEFNNLWHRYKDLPPISFAEISERTADMYYFDAAEHLDYIDLDMSKIPDIYNSSAKYSTGAFGLGLTEQERINYSVIYPGFTLSRFYTTEIGDYRFDLVAGYVRTDKANNPDLVYCHCIYLMIYKNGQYVTNLSYNYKTVLSFAADDYSTFSHYLRIYQLKDGVIIFDEYNDSGHGSCFLALTDDGFDGLNLVPMYGDYNELRHLDEGGMVYLFNDNIEFEVNAEENTLYYKDTAFTFHFDMIGNPYDPDDPFPEMFTVSKMN